MVPEAGQINNIQVVYFSGTGGAKRIAAAFEREAAGRGIETSLAALDRSIVPTEEEVTNAQKIADLVILVFAVHAVDAPEPVYKWIRLKEVPAGQKIAVISVSGGGEVWPNTGCRNNVNAALEKKGFRVVYEKMMCMPSNFLVPIDDHLTMHLLNAIPDKTGRILDRLLAGETRRTPLRKGRITSYLTQEEKRGSARFVKKIEITEACTGCGACARNCPVQNIEMKNSRPVLHEQCIICFRCLYLCPSRAMKAKTSLVLKNGFDIAAVEKRMQGVSLKPLTECCKGMLWKGLRDYLTDADGI